METSGEGTNARVDSSKSSIAVMIANYRPELEPAWHNIVKSSILHVVWYRCKRWPGKGGGGGGGGGA